jgi:hypothetical protein
MVWCGAGMKWMQYIVSLAALLGIVTALTVGLFSVSRIVMAASRDWLLPPFLARISPRTQTPLVAQMVFGVIIGERLARGFGVQQHSQVKGHRELCSLLCCSCCSGHQGTGLAAHSRTACT